jgi:hypothetical protein
MMWIGAELARRDDWVVSLSSDDVAELEHAAEPHVRAKVASPPTMETFPLPKLAPRLASLQHELLHGRGFFLVRGLPIERYSRAEAAAIFLGFGAHIGNPRSQNAKGHVLGHVFDLGLPAADPGVRIYQTHQRQTFHTDSSDVVGLLCLKEAKHGGDSMLVSALAIHDVMRREHPELLERLFVPMPHDRRGEVPAGQKPWFDIPVFSRFEGLITVFYQRQYFDSAQRFDEARRLTEEDVAALDRFDAIANDERLVLKMRLAPGDMQFVHNHDLLHDRTAFEDFAEPERKRHLLRLWLAVPGARPLPPAFEARYGSLEIGNRGGIITPATTALRVALEPE